MNFSFYIFGNPQGRYSQYPQDYTKDLFTPLCEGVVGARSVIFRQMDLVHYVFVENLGSGKYIGVCLIFNKIRSKCPKMLFNLLKALVENHMTQCRKYLTYASDGTILFTNAEFCDDVKAYDSLKSTLDKVFETNDKFGFEELNTKYSGIHKTEYAGFSEPDNIILQLSETCDKVVIEQKAGITDNQTYKMLTSLRSEIVRRGETIRQLNQRVLSLEKQKKQYRYVISLFILAVCCCGASYFLYGSLAETKGNLDEVRTRLAVANDSIARNQQTISALNDNVVTLTNSLEKEKQLKEKAEAIVENMQAASSFIVTGCSFSFGNNEYECKYYSSGSGIRNFKIKVIEEKTGAVCVTKEVSPYLYSGTGSFTVNFNSRMDSSEWYTFEIWSGNRLVGGSRH